MMTSEQERVLRDMEVYATDHHVPIIWENAREAFLGVVRQVRPHRVLEIGTAIGYSTLLIAFNSAEDVEITSLEFNEERHRLAQSYIERAGMSSHVNLLLGDAGKLLTQLDGTYDFVFIDAAKGQYVDYLQKVVPLLASNGVIAADNVLFRGYVRSDEKPPRRFKTIVKRLRMYLELVTKPPFQTEILENGDGLAVTWRKL